MKSRNQQDEVLSEKGWVSNCCFSGVHRDMEICLSCSEHCSAICEFCEAEEGDVHTCTDCESWEMSEKECHSQDGMCLTCLKLIQE